MDHRVRTEIGEILDQLGQDRPLGVVEVGLGLFAFGRGQDHLIAGEAAGDVDADVRGEGGPFGGLIAEHCLDIAPIASEDPALGLESRWKIDPEPFALSLELPPNLAVIFNVMVNSFHMNR